MVSSNRLRMLFSVVWFVVKLLALCELYEQLVMCDLFESSGTGMGRKELCHGRNICNLLN